MFAIYKKSSTFVLVTLPTEKLAACRRRVPTLPLAAHGDHKHPEEKEGGAGAGRLRKKLAREKGGGARLEKRGVGVSTTASGYRGVSKGRRREGVRD